MEKNKKMNFEIKDVRTYKPESIEEAVDFYQAMRELNSLVNDMEDLFNGKDISLCISAIQNSYINMMKHLIETGMDRDMVLHLIDISTEKMKAELENDGK